MLEKTVTTDIVLKFQEKFILVFLMFIKFRVFVFANGRVMRNGEMG